MKTAIIGPGAMGGLFGSLLTRAGKEVWLVGNRQEQIDRICSIGLALEEERTDPDRPDERHSGCELRWKSGPGDLFLSKPMTSRRQYPMPSSLKRKTRYFLRFRMVLAMKKPFVIRWIPRRWCWEPRVMGPRFFEPGHIRHAGWGKTFIGERDHRITDRALQLLKCFARQESTQKFPRISTTRCGENSSSM